jgi:hypothetical protein
MELEDDIGEPMSSLFIATSGGEYGGESMLLLRE